MHDSENAEKINAEIEESSKKGNVNQTSSQKSNEEMYRAFLGKFLQSIIISNQSKLQSKMLFYIVTEGLVKMLGSSKF